MEPSDGSGGCWRYINVKREAWNVKREKGEHAATAGKVVWNEQYRFTGNYGDDGDQRFL